MCINHRSEEINYAGQEVRIDSARINIHEKEREQRRSKTAARTIPLPALCIFAYLFAKRAVQISSASRAYKFFRVRAYSKKSAHDADRTQKKRGDGTVGGKFFGVHACARRMKIGLIFGGVLGRHLLRSREAGRGTKFIGKRLIREHSRNIF